MRRLQVAFFVLVLCFSGAVAAQDANNEKSLAGNWTGRTADGIFTQLEVTANGKFIFREQYSSDPRRAYLCGRLTDLGDTLSLNVRQMTERLADGAIEHAVGETTMVVDVIRRSGSELVVRFDDRTIILNAG